LINFVFFDQIIVEVKATGEVINKDNVTQALII